MFHNGRIISENIPFFSCNINRHSPKNSLIKSATDWGWAIIVGYRRSVNDPDLFLRSMLCIMDFQRGQFTDSINYQGRSAAMFKYIGIAILAIVLTVSFSAIAFTQDKMGQDTTKKADMMKSDMKKGDMDKEMAMGPLKSVACDPSCGFMVQSHNENELISMVKMHAKKMHNKVLSDKDVKAMMKTVEPPASKD